MNVALAKTETGRAVNSVFTVARERLPGSGKVADVRGRAFEAFERAGLPNRRIEEWKYTDLRALMREVLPLAPAPDADAIKRARIALKTAGVKGATRLVLVDGVFVSELSDAAETGVTVKTLRQALEDGDGNLLTTDASDAMIALNAAMATDGVVISVADGANLARPLQIIHVATASKASAFTRSHVRIGKGARATLVESFVAADGAKAYQVNDAVILSVGDGADLSHVRLMADSADAANITSGIFTVGAKARVQSVQHDQRRRAQPLLRSSSRCRARARTSTSTASICSRAPSTATPRWWSTMPCRIAPAARFSAPSSTTAPIRCSRAASSCAPMRRRPTAR